MGFRDHMFTYQIQERVFITENGKNLSFPNMVELEIFLEPSEMFGVGDKLTRTIKSGSAANLEIDLNTGKYGFSSGHLKEPIEVGFETTNRYIRFEMHGNMVYAKFKSAGINELEPVLISLVNIFPTLLNIELGEPPVVKYILGRVGDVPFKLVRSKSTMISLSFSTKERQEQFIKDSFNRLIPVTLESNRRLAAALYYYYVAKRLIEAGNSPQEFMAEIILNYCKVLEILFSDRRAAVREGLLELGYSDHEIDINFMPVMLLRNEFDVGHVTISMFKPKELNALHDYIGHIDVDFIKLLKLITDKVMDGSYHLRLDSDLKPDNKKQKLLDRLLKDFEEKAKE